MRLQTDTIGLAALVLVTLAWVLFCLLLFLRLLRKKPPGVEEAKRAPASTRGIALQSLSFALVWSLPRTTFWPFPPSRAGEIALAAVAVALAYASCWFCFWAINTLGKQWTYAARVIKGHELITQGPYAVVRNPIYLGMFGVILATGLVFSRWWTFLIAVVFFLIGNRIRIRTEEQLLHETFGPQFEDYARRVPAFLPFHS
jgi:protein-S-isoprenylcysteine O-methyltransferase Ste14